MVEAATPFRTIDELAQVCGQYCWVETRLFEITGQWAGDDGDPEVQIFFSAVAHAHAAIAGAWRARLPVRAGIDPEKLIASPSGPLADAMVGLEGLGETQPRLRHLVREVLPSLLTAYAEELSTASLVREAPVAAALSEARPLIEREVTRGSDLLQ
jgi:hypothetical protein